MSGALPLLFTSNAFVPLDAMPAWMGAVARVNPLTDAIETMRVLVIEGWRGTLAASLVVLVVAAAYLALGTQQFQRQTGERVN